MKRCSECHFTFEDYQQVCDFDGTNLTDIPEPSSLSNRVSVPMAVSRSPVRWLLRSPISLAVFAVAGVVLSAVLLGYYDSRNQPNIEVVSNAESVSSVVTPAPPAQVDTPIQAETPSQRPRSITTQRRITAAEKSGSVPSSMIRWPSEQRPVRKTSITSRSRPARSIPQPPATSKQVASKRRSEKTNRQSLARNHQTAFRSQKKESKVVAMLKKTGRILKRPFDFFADR
jgi:hypothetical protein